MAYRRLLLVAHLFVVFFPSGVLQEKAGYSKGVALWVRIARWGSATSLSGPFTVLTVLPAIMGEVGAIRRVGEPILLCKCCEFMQPILWLIVTEEGLCNPMAGEYRFQCMYDALRCCSLQLYHFWISTVVVD